MMISDKKDRHSLSIQLYGQQYHLLVENEELVLKAIERLKKTIEVYRQKIGEKVSIEKLAILSAIALSETALEQESLLVSLRNKLVEVNKAADKAVAKEKSF